MRDAAHDITREQFDEWTRQHREYLSSMRFRPALDRERAMLYTLESMLLRVRLSIGLGDPGTPTHDLDEICEEEEENLEPDGVRESE